MLYIVALCVLLALYVAVLFLMRYFKNAKLTNFIFFTIIYVCYLVFLLIIYLDVGFYDWNFQNALPPANVSPFMFSVVPLYLILPRRIKKYFFLLISLLSVGMILSPILNCIRCATLKNAFHPHLLLDYVSHATLSLWGIYLVRTEQAKITVRDCVIGGSIIVGVAVVMLCLNLIFDTSFFGLSLRGKHNIYNAVLVENSFLSVFIYFCGLTTVLFAGFFTQKYLTERFIITNIRI